MALVPKRRFLSPLRHRSLWGQKVRKRLGKARPAPRLRSERGRLRGFGLRAELFSTEVGNPTSLHTEVGSGAGLVPAWCGPGAGLVRAWRGPGAGQSWVGRRIAPVNPVVGAGLLHSILSLQQDCPSALPAALAWSRSCLSTAL